MVRPATRSEDLGTALFATWLIVGLFVDGWAHNHQPGLESFWTPWHAIFYSGFAATAAWITWIARSRLGEAKTLSDTLPPGYRLAAVGLVVFGIGGVGDAVWHSVFGVETSADALFSPTHILLFLGAILVVTAPLRSGMLAPHDRMISARDFLPSGISATLLYLLIGFFTQYGLAQTSDIMNVPLIPGVRGEFQMIFGVFQVFLSTTLIVAIVTLVARRWRTPAGTFTIMFGVSGILFQAMVTEFDRPWQVLSSVAAGVAADLYISMTDPTPATPLRWLGLGAVVPLAMWSVHTALFMLLDEMGWTVEVWSGLPVLAAVLGAGVAHLSGRGGARSPVATAEQPVEVDIGS